LLELKKDNDICLDCPRRCVKPYSFCGKTQGKIRIARAMKFFLEEPLICPKDKGCGAVFFSFCSLKCSYCQNYDISHKGVGVDLSESQLANLLKKIDRSDVATIDLITPTHYTTNVLSALKKAKVKKPVVWNSSGFEKASNIEKMKGLVDVFLFDVLHFGNKKGKGNCS